MSQLSTVDFDWGTCKVPVFQDKRQMSRASKLVASQPGNLWDQMEFQYLFILYDKDPIESVSESHSMTQDALLILVERTAIGF